MKRGRPVCILKIWNKPLEVNNAISGEKDFSTIFRVILPNGKTRWIEQKLPSFEMMTAMPKNDRYQRRYYEFKDHTVTVAKKRGIASSRIGKFICWDGPGGHGWQVH